MRIASFVRVAAVVSFTVLASGAAHAVYRCGNVYQDRPCDDGGPQPHLTPGMKAAPAPPVAPARGGAAAEPSPFAAVCSRIGQAAQHMVWKREGGATQEAQMADLPRMGSREEMVQTLDSVYRKRGSAPAIRATVEAECIAEKQQAADTAAALKALVPRQAGTSPAATSPAPAAADAASAAAVKKATAADTGPSSSCPGLRLELNSVNDEFRKGGNAIAMERLQNRRREVEARMREARC